MANKKLLIIDDEENMCHMLQAMLERQGYNVNTALDGRSGLELIKETTYDFVLCDVRMPRMDGMAFLKQGKEFLGDTTLIMMSAFGSVETALEAMKAGASTVGLALRRPIPRNACAPTPAVKRSSPGTTAASSVSLMLP